MDNCCKRCNWWEPIKEPVVLAENNGLERGRCHCKPPVATPIMIPQVNKITQQVTPQVIESTIWPITTSVMWCGEFKVEE